ncbi:MAG: lipocalin family protein [Roseateles sp.]|uniref:lipocalin family protein n=1 Tax=Roseateles sp. TaxID=1971397 RepID=UPI0040361E37
MNATRPPWPASLSHAEAAGDIDEQIRLIEHRLIAREENLRRGVADFSGQLRETLSPRRLLVPVGGALLGVVALASLWRRPRPQPVAVHLPPEAPSGSLPPHIPWMQLLGLAWPMLPERWRHRVNPATVSSLVVLGQPLIDSLLGQRDASPLEVMPEVDLARLSGRWFLVAELPPPLQAEAVEPPELGLLPRDDGHFDLLQRRIDADGTHGSEARVQAVPGSRGARLRLSRWPEALQWLSHAWSDLAVLHVDEDYDAALIGSPGRDTLWVLARHPALDAARRQALVLIARDRGFAVDSLRFHGAGGDAA